MKKKLLLLILIILAQDTYSQILGNLVSIYPNTAEQGQTLTTTITQQAGSYLLGSPPCDNYGIYLLQGTDIIYSNFYNWQGMDIVDVDFSIPAAAPIGLYDVYLASAYFDWWWGTCTTIGYWVLYSGFEVTLNTNVNQLISGESIPVVYPNPISEKSTLTFSNNERKKYSLSVMDSFGRKVFSEIVSTDHVTLNRKDMDAGIYFYRLEGMENNASFMGKFTIMK